MNVIKTNEPTKQVVLEFKKSLELNKKQPILLLLSGGSWLNIYEQLGLVLEEYNLTVGVLDERYSKDPKVNNFAQIMETKFYRSAMKSKVGFIDTRVQENESRQDLTKRFEKCLKDWKEQNPNGVVVITMGMGTDGHTAGIFAEMADMFGEEGERSSRQEAKLPVGLIKEKWIIDYSLSQKTNPHSERVTVTPYFLLHEVDKTVVFVKGSEKREILKKVLLHKEYKHALPATIWHHMDDVTVVIDCLT